MTGVSMIMRPNTGVNVTASARPRFRAPRQPPPGPLVLTGKPNVLDWACITYGNEIRPSTATRHTQTVRNPPAALTLTPGSLQPSSDCADQYLSATARS